MFHRLGFQIRICKLRLSILFGFPQKAARRKKLLQEERAKVKLLEGKFLFRINNSTIIIVQSTNLQSFNEQYYFLTDKNKDMLAQVSITIINQL